jgi:hypothetical protein
VANLSIPERYQFGVSKIRELDMDTVRAFRNALDSIVYSDQQPTPASTAADALEAVSPSGTAKVEYRKNH